MAETTVTIASTLAALVEGKKYATLRGYIIARKYAEIKDADNAQ